MIFHAFIGVYDILVPTDAAKFVIPIGFLHKYMHEKYPKVVKKNVWNGRNVKVALLFWLSSKLKKYWGKITLLACKMTPLKTAIVYTGQTNTAPSFKSEKRIANLIKFTKKMKF